MQLLASKVHFVAPKRLPKSLKKASWRSQESPKGVVRALIRQQVSGPGPRGGVGEGLYSYYMRIVAPSTRPEAQGLGGFLKAILR